jgi:hypothetical protein
MPDWTKEECERLLQLVNTGASVARLRGFAANHENRSEIRRGNWADRFQPSTSLGGSERLSSKPLRELRAVNGDDRTLNEGV